MRKSLGNNAVDLHAHSTYSLSDGAGSPENVVKRVKELGWSAACLSEHGWMGSAVPFYLACQKHGIKCILANEMYVVPDEVLGVHDKETRSLSRHLTVLALSREGYSNLVAWTSFSMLRENYYHKPRISLSAMAEIAPYPLRHNVVLSGCLGSELSQELLNGSSDPMAVGRLYIESIKELFPNFYIEIQNHYQPSMFARGFTAYDNMIGAQSVVREKLLQLAEQTDTPVVLTNDSHYQSQGMRKSHMAMLASKGWRTKNVETHHQGTTERGVKGYAQDYLYLNHFLQPLEPIAERTGVDLDNVRQIVAEANIRLEPLRVFSYSLPVSQFQKPLDEIVKRCKPRLKRLVHSHGHSAQVRFDRELSAMGDFAHYLLLMADFLQDAHDQGILTSTRGSAANSIVCYCLQIHDIDSIEYQLTFERFVNPARKKLPDIDVDIAADRQPEFVKMAQERMRELEGEGQVLPICTLGTIANRKAFRMVADVLGMPEDQQNELAQLLPQMIDTGFASQSDVYEQLKDDYPELEGMASQVFDSINSIGQHPCGYVFGTKERPLKEWVPTYLIASSGATVTQYDMKAIEKFGLCKMDWLRLDTLTIMQKIMRAIGWDTNDLRNMPLDDERTYEMLCQGRTDGVHSMQGKTQRKGCIEVQPRTIHDLVAIQALYRPSGTRTGFDKMFVNRRRGKEEWSVPEIVRPILEMTHGVPIFQEQVLDIAYAVGCSDAEVQTILDAIKEAKGVGRGAAEAFEALKEMFVNHAAEVMDEDDAASLWNFIESASGYYFNKGHSTAYSILAYQTAYFKANYPAEFFAALLNTYPNNPRFVTAARGEGFKMLPPDVSLSADGFTKGGENEIRVGLLNVKGVGPGAANELVNKQPYSSMDDLRQRCSKSKVREDQIGSLKLIGAMQSLGIRAHATDEEQFELLGFCLTTPKAFKGIKPKIPPRKSGSWKFSGLTTGVDTTEGKQFVAKAFWVPENTKISLKASPWAQVKSYLLEAVDINGLKFELVAAEKKFEESSILRALEKFGKGTVIIAEGQIALPYLRGGPPSFRVWGITGAEDGEPLIYHGNDELEKMVVTLAKAKQHRRAA